MNLSGTSGMEFFIRIIIFFGFSGYEWFSELLNKKSYSYLLTAHHSDDLVETIFINLLRGTGLNGLVPLQHFNGNRFRPLIQFEKRELEAYLKNNNYTFREDQSNASEDYLRNKIRLSLLPKLEEISSNYKKSFQKTRFC